MDINTTSIEKAIAQLRQLDQQTFKQIMRYVGGRVGVTAEGLARVYPPERYKPLPAIYTRTRYRTRKKYRKDPTTGERTVVSQTVEELGTYQSKFKSEKSQKKVFALIRATRGKKKKQAAIEGRIYTRTGNLGASMTHEVSVSDDGTTVSVGSNLNYAPLVLGDEGVQSPYHADIWIPLSQRIQEAENQIVRQVEDDLFDAVNPYFK